MILKKKLKNIENTFGTWININNILIPEIIALSDFDWLCFDLEHSSIDYSSLQNLLISNNNNQIASLVRVPDNDESIIKKVMDMGADGIIVPNIKTKEEATKAVRSIKYYPKGDRGVGLFRAQSYGNRFKEYFLNSNKNNILILQIENIKAVENIEEIANVKDIDCFFVGPYDLSCSMQIPGDFKNIKFKKALNRILKFCKSKKISIGIHSVSTDYREAIKYKKMGFNFIGLSIDTIMLKDMSNKLLNKVKNN